MKNWICLLLLLGACATEIGVMEESVSGRQMDRDYERFQAAQCSARGGVLLRTARQDAWECVRL